MGSRNRVSYAVQDIFVGSPGSGEANFVVTGYTGDGALTGQQFQILKRLNTVQSFDYTFDMPRSDAQVLGKTSPADRISEAPPAIQANLSYYLEGINNELRLGFSAQNQLDPQEVPFVSGLMFPPSPDCQGGRNLYLVSTKEGEGGLRDVTYGAYPVIETGSVLPYFDIDDFIDNNSPSYNTFIIQNCYVNSYQVKFQVGELATVDVGLIGDAGNFLNTASGVSIPHLSAYDGSSFYKNRAGTRVDQSEGVKFFIPRAFESNPDELTSIPKYKSFLFSSKDIDLSITQDNPSGINWIIDSVQSCEISLTLARDPVPYLGYKLYTDRPVKMPVKATISMELLTSGNVTGDFLSSFEYDAKYNLNINLKGHKNITGAKIVEDVLKYKISGADLLAADYTSTIGTNKTTSLNFGLDIDFDDPTRNLYVSGKRFQLADQYVVSGGAPWPTLVDDSGNALINERTADLFPVF
tara:strand:- start:1752 stop:3152 length:1401 start_codon:yes stop_codon:yes gene_type:complete